MKRISLIILISLFSAAPSYTENEKPQSANDQELALTGIIKNIFTLIKQKTELTKEESTYLEEHKNHSIKQLYITVHKDNEEQWSRIKEKLKKLDQSSKSELNDLKKNYFRSKEIFEKNYAPIKKGLQKNLLNFFHLLAFEAKQKLTQEEKKTFNSLANKSLFQSKSIDIEILEGKEIIVWDKVIKIYGKSKNHKRYKMLANKYSKFYDQYHQYIRLALAMQEKDPLAGL